MNEDSRFEWLGVLKEADEFGMGVERPPDGSGRPNQTSLGQAIERDWIDAQKLSRLCARVRQLVYAGVLMCFSGTNRVHSGLYGLGLGLNQIILSGVTLKIIFKAEVLSKFEQCLGLVG